MAEDLYVVSTKFPAANLHREVTRDMKIPTGERANVAVLMINHQKFGPLNNVCVRHMEKKIG